MNPHNPVRQILRMARNQSRTPGAQSRESGAGRDNGSGVSSPSLPSTVTSKGVDGSGDIFTVVTCMTNIDSTDSGAVTA